MGMRRFWFWMLVGGVFLLALAALGIVMERWDTSITEERSEFCSSTFDGAEYVETPDPGWVCVLDGEVVYQ